MILFRRGQHTAVTDVQKDSDGRCLGIKCKIDNIEIALCNVYAPNHDDPEFFVQVIEIINTIQSEHVIMGGGDFNLVMNPELDRQGIKPPTTHTRALAMLNIYMKEMDMCDIWHNMHLDSREFTWYRLLPQPTFSRLDMFLINVGLSGYIQCIEHKPSFKSNHSIVMMSFQFEEEKRGQGIWRLNTRLLFDKQYVDMMNKIIEDTQNVHTNLDSIEL